MLLCKKQGDLSNEQTLTRPCREDYSEWAEQAQENHSAASNLPACGFEGNS